MGAGTLTIRNGSSIYSEYGYLGYKSGASGTATVDGAGSKWTCTTLNVGRLGSGTLEIANNGNVTASSCYLGDSTAGKLNVTNGGSFNTSSCFVGHGSNDVSTATVNGRGSIWNASSSLHVGYTGSGEVSISNGGSLKSSGSDCIGSLSNTASGTVTVDGTGSTWSSDTSLTVGVSGNGTLNVINGGSVNSGYSCLGHNSGSSGEATVEGAGSTWTCNSNLAVGSAGTGTLNIFDGGRVSVSGATYVAGPENTINFGVGGGTFTTHQFYLASLNSLTGKGTVRADGLISDFDVTFSGTATPALAFGTAGTLTVDMSKSSANADLGAGYTSNGTLNVTNGAKVFSANGYLGIRSGSAGSATVDGTGSEWTNKGLVYVGLNGSGTLSIINGGCVVDAVCDIGEWSGSSGVVTIDGANSTWNTSTVYTGLRGAGTVTQLGGMTTVGSVLYLGYYSDSQGTYNLNGGTLKLRSLAKGSGTATFNFGGGTLRASETLSTSVPMTLTGTGGDARVDTAGYPVTFSGQLSGEGGLNKLGASTLTLTAANNYKGDTAVSTGTLTLASTASLLLWIDGDENSLISVASNAKLDLYGTVRLEIGNVTALSENWSLTTGNGTTIYEPSFSLATSDGAQFTQTNDIWTYTTGERQWTFNEGTGILSLTPVPEPCTLALLVIVAITLPACGRRRHRI